MVDSKLVKDLFCNVSKFIQDPSMTNAKSIIKTLSNINNMPHNELIEITNELVSDPYDDPEWMLLTSVANIIDYFQYAEEDDLSDINFILFYTAKIIKAVNQILD